MQDDTQAKYLRLPTLAEYRQEAAQRRALAFCGAPETVLGVRVLPLTPHTYSMLFASGSHFIHGGEATVDDVLYYAWFHSPLFVLPEHPEHDRRKRAALRPIMVHFTQPWRRMLLMRPDRHRAVASLAIAISEIGKMVEDAFADAPTGGGGAPIAALEAHLVHAVCSTYPAWTPERASNTPLAQMFQLYRCILQSRGVDIQDRREAAILAAHLRLRNEQLAAERAATTGANN